MTSHSEILKKHISIMTILLIIVGSTSLSDVQAGNLIKGAFVSGIYKKLKNKDYDNAIKKCRKLRKKHLYKDYSYFLEGMAFYFKKDYITASDRFSQSIALSNKRGEAYFYRSSSYLHLNKPDEALNDVNMAINNKKTPELLAKLNKQLGYSSSEAVTRSSMYWLRSRIYYAQKQLDIALNDINKAITMSPKPFAVSYFHRGNIYFIQNKYKLAYQDFQKTVKLNPKATDAWITIGVIAFYFGNYKVDVNVCKKVLELDPENVSASMNLSLAYWLDGDHEKGLDLMKNVRQLQTDPIACYHLGYYYHVKGDQDLALESFKKANELNSDILKIRESYINRPPKFSPTRKFYQDQLETAKIYIETGKTPKAIEFENKTAEITFTGLSVTPDPVLVDKPFDIEVRFKTVMAGTENEIPILFNFTISQNNEVLFESKSSTINADSGKITHWKAHMNPVPVEGAYTIKGFLRYKKTVAEETITLNIK
ncbi:MAG: tetratricopeptide repeat protein [Holophagae bacterium]|nr:tetratricopeptide repeat protein [Holophagae bacterium]